MGYTNYWKQKTDIPLGKWKKIKDEYNDYVLPVAGDLIKDDSEIDDITFHGSCETFCFNRKAKTEADRRYPEEKIHFNYCKTRGDKYDLAVWYLLISINKICPEIIISRDAL